MQWKRTRGNEHWEFDNNGIIRIRDMSANDYPIQESALGTLHLQRRIPMTFFTKNWLITLGDEG